MIGDPSPAGPITSWRAATPADAPALTALHAAARRAEGAPDEVLSSEEIDHRLTDPGLDLAADTRAGLDPQGRLLAFGSVWCRPAPVHLARAILAGDVHPEARRQGVGRALARWQEVRARERLGTEPPAHLPRRVDLYAPVGDEGRAAVARLLGMAPLRWFHKMTRSLAEKVTPGALPSGLEMAAWTDAWSDAVLEARDDAWRDHWGYEPMPPAVWRHLFVDDPAFLRRASRLALHEGRVVGFVLCTEQATDEAGTGRTAWLDHIAVRDAWRRRGVASALMSAALVALADGGFRSAALDVDADSPTGAVGLYERQGFRVVRTEVLYGRDTGDAAAPGAGSVPRALPDPTGPHRTAEGPEGPGAQRPCRAMGGTRGGARLDGTRLRSPACRCPLLGVRRRPSQVRGS